MNLYCYKENGIFSSPSLLPLDTPKYSNFRNFDSDDNEIFLRELGYYRYEQPIYDSSFQSLGEIIELPNSRVTNKVLDISLNDFKLNKFQEISDSFKNEMMYGKTDTGLGWEIDARRYDVHNDIENMELLYEEMAANNEGNTYVKGADNLLYSCTLEQVANLIILIRRKGLQNYQKKHMLELQIDAATTVEELINIKWG